MAKKKSKPKKIESIRHKDKRTNIPTEELRDFVADDELTPKTILYPRDPSLDPQLVWKGKDKQDHEDLTIPIVPIYIQEKMHPRVIIDELLAQTASMEIERAAEEAADYQINLFSDFNGGPHDFQQKVEFYQHEQNWSNRLILGDSLLVMVSLAEKEGLKGKVQTIYIDPPYGIKFGSNWQVSTRKREVKDGKSEDATRQPEQVRAFRDTWKLGIHSYLAYLRDRLVVSRDLLTETGSIFIQIGDENAHLVRSVMDEVFGSENYVATISFTKTSGQTKTNYVPIASDYIILYAKNYEIMKFRQLFIPKVLGGDGSKEHKFVELSDGSTRPNPITKDEIHNTALLPENSCIYATGPIVSAGYSEKGSADIVVTSNGKKYTLSCGPRRHWAVGVEGTKLLWEIGRLVHKKGLRIFKRYFNDFPYSPTTNTWTDTRGETDMSYVVQTSRTVIERCILMTTDPGDLVLDPTCGSGTTAFVAEQWGRRWITCDTSRVALALSRTRMMAAKYPYYLLTDSSEGMKKEAELTGKILSEFETEEDIRKGFVYERVPHITLKSIANNPDIKKDMTRKGIEAAIASHAITETLYDKPYSDNKRVRVCGPFSVESLSPHRVLSTADENMDGTVTEQEAHKQQDFVSMILDNLKKTGVQNARKEERLNFNRLDPHAGVWLHATGEYSDVEGKIRRVAVSIGPEHGTVGPEQVKEAAKEAVQGVGFDILIICGFAFDPHVNEEVKRYGKLSVLPAKMNPDLAMGDELLKKTGAGNLFMVFGEPDVEITKQRGLQIVVEIKGVDVYDPTTGQIRSASTDDIACWFIDTDYNGESFFVRHAYFTGAGEPYKQLKRALRAEIDEAAWSNLYSTMSRPFDNPESGKIAVKVINHYGDEVLKVFEV